MRTDATIPTLRSARLLLAALLVLSAGGFSCRKTVAPTNRLVLIVDPTVLRDVDSAEFDRQVGARLRASVSALPEDTYIDLYFVGQGQAGVPAEFRDSLPFRENESSDEGHIRRAKVIGDTVAKLVEARWAASNERPNNPSSCILTALYRAQEMTKLGARQGQRVSLVVVSDFLEACTDTGYNFEREIPDSVGSLPVTANLSGANRLLMLRTQTSGAVRLKDEPRLIHAWTELLNRWHADTTAMEFTPTFPENLVAS